MSELKAKAKKLEAEINKLLAQIKAEGVTYSIGDRFFMGDEKLHLVCVDEYTVNLVNLKTGSSTGTNTKVGDCRFVSKSDLAKVCESSYIRKDVTRYWDDNAKRYTGPAAAEVREFEFKPDVDNRDGKQFVRFEDMQGRYICFHVTDKDDGNVHFHVSIDQFQDIINKGTLMIRTAERDGKK